MTTLNAEGGAGPDRTVLESYVPVAYGASVGVFELYADYAPISATRGASSCRWRSAS